MHKSIEKKVRLKEKRTFRVRKKINGTALRPRLCVAKTNSHIHAQLIDDENGVTLAAATTLSKDNRRDKRSSKTSELAKKIGEQIAKSAKEKKIDSAIFDRGASKYHGVLKELAEAAREAGLKI